VAAGLLSGPAVLAFYMYLTPASNTLEPCKNICHGFSTPGVFELEVQSERGVINERRSSSSEGNRQFGTWKRW